MEERKFVKVRKDEFDLREFLKKTFGKGRVSSIRVEYTPVGEKIVIRTHKPGIIIGKRGEKIIELTEVLKKKFNMENPHIEIEEIKKPYFDAQLVADEIALLLERFGSIRFKAVCYKALTKIKASGALGAEIRVSGKLPSDRAKTWPFSFGYLKKTGEPSKIVEKAQSVAETKQGVIGIKVSILSPDVPIYDKIDVSEEFINKIKENSIKVKK
ncbi:MAG: 30S ribosomal protein S3 [Nanoarchaeota archaeon]